MEKEFREFYNKDEIDFEKLDNSILIVVDTNVLLHIFRFSIKSREKLIKTLKKVKGNIWIPYHVGLEYNLNKVELIGKMRRTKNDLIKEIGKETNDFKKKIFKNLDNIGINSNDEKSVREEIKTKFEESLTIMLEKWKTEELEKEFDLIGSVEDESKEIAKLFFDKVGFQITQKEIDEIETEGQKRYELGYPPGFKDSGKGNEKDKKYGDITYNEKYSDLIIWKQIIKQAKDPNIKKVVFITDDEKGDWQYIHNGEKKGPRAELKKELLDEANADLYLYNTNSFLNKVNGGSHDIVDLNFPIDLGDFRDLESYEYKKKIYETEDNRLANNEPKERNYNNVYTVKRRYIIKALVNQIKELENKFIYLNNEISDYIYEYETGLSYANKSKTNYLYELQQEVFYNREKAEKIKYLLETENDNVENIDYSIVAFVGGGRISSLNKLEKDIEIINSKYLLIENKFMKIRTSN
ncbi:MAG: PIN-like domain-containing protein [Carnobacterium sp.]|uniref:PIN-like domain-containing protein n=1 Tax=Carnobacterium sp. TaxID=48221 RepID=UPI003C710870